MTEQVPSEQYDIAEGESVHELLAAVKSYMAGGWRPLGGVAVAAYSFEDRNGYNCTSTTYCQAMVKP